MNRKLIFFSDGSVTENLSWKHKFRTLLRHTAGKLAFMMLLCLMGIGSLQAQSPGGIAGAAVWVKADKDVFKDENNVPAVSRTSSGSCCGLTEALSVMSSPSSWAGASAAPGLYITMDLGSDKSVQGVVTKGRGDYPQWVTAYTVSYATTAAPGTFISLGSFTGNTDQITSVTNTFAPVTARYIRITETAFNGHPCMRCDVVLSGSTTDITTTGGIIGKMINQANPANNFFAELGTITHNGSSNLWNFNPTITYSGDCRLGSQVNTPTAANQNYTKFLTFFATKFDCIIESSHTSTDMFPNWNNWGTGLSGAGNPGSLYVGHASASPGVPVYGSSTTVYNRYNFGTVNVDRTSTTGVYCGVNGTNGSTGSGPALGNSGVFRTVLGGLYSADALLRHFEGYLPEFIQYNSALSSTDAQKVESYLAIKWGITQGHDYFATDGTTTYSIATFGNNVAGIGRDNNTALNQKQSKSVNNGNQVVMALGTAALTNQANAGTITTDKQFLVWGNNNAALTNLVITGWATTTNRFTRRWKLQNTNSFSQSVTVYFPASAFSVIAGNPTLIYNTSSTLTGPGTEVPNSGTTTINGVSYYKFTTIFPTTAVQYFSFGGAQTVNPGGVTGAAMWVRADAGVNYSSGSTISQWTNQMNAANNYVTSTGAVSHVTSGTLMNFNPQASFNGASTLVSQTPIVTAVNQSVSKFSIVNGNNGTIEGAGNGAGGNNWHWYKYGTDPTASILYGLNSSVNACFGPAGSYASIPVAATVRYNSAGTGSFAGMNGLFDVAGTNVQTQNVLTSSLGSIYSSAYYFNGNINEYIQFNSLLNVLETRQVESYEAIKYGITLSRNNNGIAPSGEAVTGQAIAYNEGDYIAADGNTRTWISDATYHNNVAGIGRDDNTALDQRISRSVSSSILTISTDTDFTSKNAGGTHPAISGDKKFLIAGDNGLAATATSPTTINGVSFDRINKIWKIQDTNGMGCTNLQFDIATFPALAVGEKWYAVIADDTAFTINVELKELTAASGKLTTGVNLATNSTQYLAILQSPAPAASDLNNVKTGISVIPDWVPTAKNTYLEINAKNVGMVLPRFDAATIPPANLIEGMMIFNTATNTIQVFNGSVWRNLKASPTTKFCN